VSGFSRTRHARVALSCDQHGGRPHAIKEVAPNPEGRRTWSDAGWRTVRKAERTAEQDRGRIDSPARLPPLRFRGANDHRRLVPPDGWAAGQHIDARGAAAYERRSRSRPPRPRSPAGIRPPTIARRGDLSVRTPAAEQCVVPGFRRVIEKPLNARVSRTATMPERLRLVSPPCRRSVETH
jgi:hypothetical protein